MRILAWIVTILLFIGPVVLAVMGWPVEGDAFKELHLYPAYYILLVYVLFAFVTNRMDKFDCGAAIRIIILTFLWYIGSKVLGEPRSKMILFNSMALPAMYFIFYRSLKGDENRKMVKNILIFMFLLNSLMAIYERLTMTLLFPFDIIRSDFFMDRVTDYTFFRSSALLGHPLTNALMMAIVMAFILISKLHSILKYILYFIGMVGLLCFNSRAAIMISGGVLGLFLMRLLFKKESSFLHRLFAFFMLAISVLLGIYMLRSGFGGRIEENSDLSQDDSTLARIQVWDIFLQGDITDFLWGMSGNDAEKIAFQVMGIVHIENWFILSSMIVGLVITTIVVILFVPLFRKMIRPYDRFSSFLIILVVVGLSSTNNSLACGVQAIAMFFACSYAFEGDLYSVSQDQLQYDSSQTGSDYQA